MKATSASRRANRRDRRRAYRRDSYCVTGALSLVDVRLRIVAFNSVPQALGRVARKALGNRHDAHGPRNYAIDYGSQDMHLAWVQIQTLDRRCAIGSRPVRACAAELQGVGLFSLEGMA